MKWGAQAAMMCAGDVESLNVNVNHALVRVSLLTLVFLVSAVVGRTKLSASFLILCLILFI